MCTVLEDRGRSAVGFDCERWEDRGCSAVGFDDERCEDRGRSAVGFDGERCIFAYLCLAQLISFELRWISCMHIE